MIETDVHQELDNGTYVHSKKCNVRLLYVKRTFNAWIEHITFNVYFFTIRYECVLKNMHLTHSMRNMFFTIS